ncbi:MAG: class I SAM-dependent RNA methyltransferase [Actinomycetota bacterium]|nr:MAG: class I SAM-dependent RNA methyltransferase [Actinomycetota bacterium]
MQPGAEFVVEVGPVAHGGHCVARHDGQVVFVRHALPGERVRVVVTGVGARGRYLRADAVAVLAGAAGRRTPPCPHAGPGRCGGCDWQHAVPELQRDLKAAVVREQLERLGGVHGPLVDAIQVEPVAGDDGGLGWRSRVRWGVDEDGRPGLRRHRSHDLEVIEHCPLVTAGVDRTGASRTRWPAAQEVHVVASAVGDRVVTATPAGSPQPALSGDVVVHTGGPAPRVRERAAGRTWRVSATGFWQAHPGAADAFVAAVAAYLQPRPGEHLLDLYCGVGLFAGALAASLGPGGRVDAVEADGQACADARRNLHDLPTVRLHHDRVERWWTSRAAPKRCDLVVLDPPRSGAGEAVLRGLVRRRPRAVAYVACDPAALARDVRTMGSFGYVLQAVRAFDAFPNTHHLECVALLTKTGSDLR